MNFQEVQYFHEVGCNPHPPPPPPPTPPPPPPHTHTHTLYKGVIGVITIFSDDDFLIGHLF